MQRLHALLAAAAFVAVPLIGCSASDSTRPEGEEEEIELADPLVDSEGDNGDEIAGGALVGINEDADDGVETPNAEPFVAGAKLRLLADLNLRESPSTKGAVLRVMMVGSEVTSVDGQVENGWLRVEHDGVQGYSALRYLELAEGPEAELDPFAAAATPTPALAIARAKASVGFSYWWGGGAWRASGPTASTKGSCRGSCPNCTHSGRYGADCSGMVGKAWLFGNQNLEVNSHPYSTASFVKSVKNKWKIIARGSVKKGDALVYHSGGAGHIVIYEKGDAWKTPTVYECKGCAAGCVHNARSFGSAYKGVRRAGF